MTVPYYGGCNGNFGQVYYVTPSLEIIDLKTELWNAAGAKWNAARNRLESCGYDNGVGHETCTYYSFKKGKLRKELQGALLKRPGT